MNFYFVDILRQGPRELSENSNNLPIMYRPSVVRIIRQFKQLRIFRLFKFSENFDIYKMVVCHKKNTRSL